MRLTKSIKEKLKLSWSDENSKLGKDDIISFNLPAFQSASGFKVCHGASVACSAFCYARQGFFTMPVVQKVYETNLLLARYKPVEFYQAVAEDLHIIPHTKIRIHSSGDFFNREYLNTWINISREYRDKQFYCYSKIYHMLIEQMDVSVPSNFLVVQSLGGKYDHLINWNNPVSKVFQSMQHFDQVNGLLEEGNKWINCSKSDLGILQNVKRVGLIFHGKKGKDSVPF